MTPAKEETPEIPAEIRKWISDEADNPMNIVLNIDEFTYGAELMYRKLQADKPTGLPWIEIKPGCEMPNYDEFVLWRREDDTFAVMEIDKDDEDWWNKDRGWGKLTHWARITGPDESTPDETATLRAQLFKAGQIITGQGIDVEHARDDKDDLIRKLEREHKTLNDLQKEFKIVRAQLTAAQAERDRIAGEAKDKMRTAYYDGFNQAHYSHLHPDICPPKEIEQAADEYIHSKYPTQNT